MFAYAPIVEIIVTQDAQAKLRKSTPGVREEQHEDNAKNDGVRKSAEFRRSALRRLQELRFSFSHRHDLGRRA